MNDGQVAAHEAGHAVVLLALGVPVDHISRVAGPNGSPLINGMERYVTMPDIPAITALEPRLQYLTFVGGMAGETTHTAFVDIAGAASDLAPLREVNLTDNQIDCATIVALEIIRENRQLWERIHDVVLAGILQRKMVFVRRVVLDQWFVRLGKRFSNMPMLDSVLPLD
jgi:hypothetical protein